MKLVKSWSHVVKLCTQKTWCCGNRMRTPLPGKGNMNAKDPLFSSRLLMWKCDVITLCLTTMQRNKKWDNEGDDLYLEQQLVCICRSYFWSYEGQYKRRHFWENVSKHVTTCELGAFRIIRLMMSWIRQEGGIHMVSSRECGKPDPILRHRQTGDKYKTLGRGNKGGKIRKEGSIFNTLELSSSPY